VLHLQGRCICSATVQVMLVCLHDIQRMCFLHAQVTWGRGFALIKGLPVWRWTRRQSILAYWGIGLYWSVLHAVFSAQLILVWPCLAGTDCAVASYAPAGGKPVPTMPRVSMVLIPCPPS
jgi:hypothetical protein